MNRYDREFSRSQHLDEKASYQMGFSGIIISILAFVFGSNGIKEIIKDQNFHWLLIGIGILLISISMGIAALTRLKKTLPVFQPENFYDKYDSKQQEEQRKQLLLAYFDLIDDFKNQNNYKAKLLYAGNILSLIGLSVSFISFLLVLHVFG